MIITLTPNPSLDKTVTVAELIPGGVNRIGETGVEPAGKGVNIARALTANGTDALAVFPCGGSTGVELVRLLDADGTPHLAVPIAGAVRTNVSVVEPDGTVTKLNEPGPVLAEPEITALIDAVVTATSPGGWVAASGSLPPGAPADFYLRLAQELAAADARLAVDTSGPALRAVVAGRPALVKPNRHELSDLLERPIETIGDVAQAAGVLRDSGVGSVLVSLGPDGALLLDDAAPLHGEVSVAEVRNTVGAGDALLAGFLAGGAKGAAALETALTWARAAVRSARTTMETPGDSDRSAVTITTGSLDLDRVLNDDEPEPADLAGTKVSQR